jgi:hypothetical protein
MRRTLTMMAVTSTVILVPALALAATPTIARQATGLPDRPCAVQAGPMRPGCFFAPAAAPAAVAARPVTVTAARPAAATPAGAAGRAGTTAATSARRPGAGRARGLRVRLAGPTRAARGQQVRYTATVVNLDQHVLRAVHLSVALPNGLAALSVHRGKAHCSAAANRVRCVLRDIRPAGEASVTVQATVTGQGWRGAAAASTQARPRAIADAPRRARGDMLGAATRPLALRPLALRHTTKRHMAARRGAVRQPAPRAGQRRFIVTARVTRVVCDGMTPAGAAATASARLTTVVRADAQATPAHRAGRTPRRNLAAGGRPAGQPRLPVTGAPLLPASAAAIALLMLGALGLAATRGHTRGHGHG